VEERKEERKERSKKPPKDKGLDAIESKYLKRKKRRRDDRVIELGGAGSMTVGRLATYGIETEDPKRPRSHRQHQHSDRRRDEKHASKSKQ
jgi:hypothetical protein